MYGNGSLGHFVEISFSDDSEDFYVDLCFAEMLDTHDLLDFQSIFNETWNQLKLWSEELDHQPIAPIIPLFDVPAG
jgi:hypothetical protein